MMGGLSSSLLSDTATQSPGSFSSFRRKIHSRMKPTLPSVRESPEFTVLSSSSDDDDSNPPNPHLWNPDIVKLEDSHDEDDVELASSVRTVPASNPSILSDSLVVSETPSKTLGSDSCRLSDAPPSRMGSFSDFDRPGGCLQNLEENMTATSICGIYERLIALGNQPGVRCVLKILDLASLPHSRVKYLPRQYNGNPSLNFLLSLYQRMV
jgi:hypothetical protein